MSARCTSVMAAARWFGWSNSGPCVGPPRSRHEPFDDRGPLGGPRPMGPAHGATALAEASALGVCRRAVASAHRLLRAAHADRAGAAVDPGADRVPGLFRDADLRVPDRRS